MKYKFGKVFKKVYTNHNELAKFSYTPSEDNYYEFVKKQRDADFKQVIITSEMMIKIIEKYFLERKFKIKNVEFMIEDKILEKEVNEILEILKFDRGNFVLLLNKLMFLIEETSIDIKKIELNSSENKKIISFFIQVNGVFAINETIFDEESEKLIEILEECI